MIPRAAKAERKRQQDSHQNVGQSFFDAPYGSTACTCGGKAVAHGHCQECWDKFNEEIKKEHSPSKKLSLVDFWRALGFN